MRILQFRPEMAVLQPTFVTQAVQNCRWSEVKMQNKQCWITPSHMGNQRIKSNRNTPCKLSRWFSMALLCFQVSSPTLDLCHCHSNVSGCVIVLSRQHFAEGCVQGSLFLQERRSAAHTHTHTHHQENVYFWTAQRWLYFHWFNKCWKNVEKLLPGLRHHRGKVSRN